MSHFHHSHHHHSHPVRRYDTVREEPVTQRQKRTWQIKGIIWTVLAGIVVLASIVLTIVFSVIESNMETGAPFIMLSVFAGVPLAFAIPYMLQGYARQPQVTQYYEEDGRVGQIKIVKVKAKCPNCEAENEFGSTNCKECGETLPQRCPVCGADLIPNDESCRDCGLALK